MKKFLLIFIFAIGIVTNASATKDTVYCSGGQPSSTFVLPVGKITSTTTLFTPTPDPTKQLYVEVGDTLIFKTVGGTIDFTINGISHNGMTVGSSFQQIISSSDSPSLIVSASYTYIGAYFTIPLHIIITEPKYSLAVSFNFSAAYTTMQTVDFATTGMTIGIDTICVAVNDTLNFFNSTGYQVNFNANSTLFNNINGNTSFQYKIKSTDLPGFYLIGTYVPLSLTRNVVYVKVRNTPTIGLKEQEDQFSTNIFPNPATNKLSLSSPNNLGKISITNLIGQVVYSSISNEKQTTLDVSTLPQGAYIVNVGGVYKKIIKE